MGFFLSLLLHHLSPPLEESVEWLAQQALDIAHQNTFNDPEPDAIKLDSEEGVEGTLNTLFCFAIPGGCESLVFRWVCVWFYRELRMQRWYDIAIVYISSIVYYYILYSVNIN